MLNVGNSGYYVIRIVMVTIKLQNKIVAGTILIFFFFSRKRRLDMAWDNLNEMSILIFSEKVGSGSMSLLFLALSNNFLRTWLAGTFVHGHCFSVIRFDTAVRKTIATNGLQG